MITTLSQKRHIMEMMYRYLDIEHHFHLCTLKNKQAKLLFMAAFESLLCWEVSG